MIWLVSVLFLDLGVEYLKYEQSVLELKPKIHSFLLQAGKKNQ
jgi:hypothetical protein